MKKIYLIGLFTFFCFIFNTNVYASSANLSVSSGSVNEGDTFSVTVNLYDVAAWNVHVNASGPVNGCSINEADVTSNALGTNKTFTTSCKATSSGNIVVVLSGDISSSNLDTFDISDQKTVYVIRNKGDDFAPTGTDNNTNNTNKPNNNNNNKSNSKNQTNSTPDSNKTTSDKSPTSDDKKADNTTSPSTKIKSISIDGVKLEKIDDNNYQAVVSYSTKTININVSAVDSNAKIFGSGSHKINVGNNNISIVVVAADGSKNKITIKVIRSDGYTLDELDKILEKKDINFIDIRLDKNYIIPAEVIKKIKKSKKTVSFNFYDDNNQLLYSWIIDGSKIKKVGDFDTSINFSSKNKDKIVKLSGYSNGVYLSFKFKYIPYGTKLNMYVGDKYSNKDILNIFNYNEKKKSLYNLALKRKIDNGFVKFNVDKNYDCFITDSKHVNGNSNEKKISIVFFGICFIVLISAIVIFIKRIKK